MKYDRDKHRRRSIRLKHYDYTKSAAYFVTIVTNSRAAFFGQITNGEMQLNEFGVHAENLWQDLMNRFPTISLDAFILDAQLPARHRSSRCDTKSAAEQFGRDESRPYTRKRYTGI